MTIDLLGLVFQPPRVREWCLSKIGEAPPNEKSYSVRIPIELMCRYRYLRYEERGDKITVWLSNGIFEKSRSNGFKDTGIQRKQTHDELNGFKEYRIQDDGGHDDGPMNQYFNQELINPFNILIMNDIKPLVNPKELVAKGGEVVTKYLEGKPRNYRFDASKGTVRLKDGTPLTKPGAAITIIPVAFRLFRDQILGFDNTMDWFEVYFFNNKHHLCSMLFHGYSVQELTNQVMQDLFYDDLEITDVALTIKPVEKSSKDGKKYYIANFDYKELTKAQKESISTAIAGMTIYREDTISVNDAPIKLSKNYGIDRAMEYAEELRENAYIEMKDLEAAAN